MKVPVIKHLVETASLNDLRVAEEAILNEQPLTMEIEGADEGEQLTHILASIWILDRMQQNNTDFKTALREYTQRVRNSIS